MKKSTREHENRPRLRGVIDVHSHAILPIGFEIPIGSPWSVDKHLATMDEHEIDVCVLSCPDAANHAEGTEAVDIARRMNEALANFVSKHPRRLGAMASLPGLTMDGTLKAMEYALDTLKLDGVCTATNINDVYLGDPRFDPWFEEMNRRKTTLFIHPTFTRATRAIDLGLHPSLLEFVFNTTRMIVNMVVSGAKQRYSQIRMISTHAGGTLPYLVTRLQILLQMFGGGSNHGKQSPEALKEGFASFFYDLTAGTSEAQLGAVLKLVPVSQLLMGYDIPYMPDWSIEPAKRALETFDGLTQDDLDHIASKNAANLYPSVAARTR